MVSRLLGKLGIEDDDIWDAIDGGGILDRFIAQAEADSAELARLRAKTCPRVGGCLGDRCCCRDGNCDGYTPWRDRP